MAFDLYQQVTDSIIASIEAGTPAWRQPWAGEGVRRKCRCAPMAKPIVASMC